MLGGEAGNYTTTDSCRMSFKVKLKTINKALLGDTLNYHERKIYYYNNNKTLFQ
jgi:hypothetical protein